MFERVSLIRFCTVTNEKLTIDDKQTANLFTNCKFICWAYPSLVYEKHDFM